MRPATATIDLDALRHNLARVRELAPRSRIAAIVKANGYGHGATRLLPALDDADMLGVACIEEAMALRDAGARHTILLLEGVFEADELPLCAEFGFEVAVHHTEQITMLEGMKLAKPLIAWLKIDSGMGRLGFRREAAPSAFARLEACANVGPIRIMSHFSSADDPHDPATREQLDRMPAINLQGDRSFANSAGILQWPESHADWVRPGIMLYGVSPMLGRAGPEDGLRPVMTLTTQLIATKEMQAGDPVGYAGTWRAPQRTRIGIAAIGYGDGYPRHAPSGTPVLVDGKPAALAGRVSMDMLAIDLTGHDEANVGAPVTLWGDGLPVETIAQHAGTIGYEALCGVTSRVHVRVVGHPAPK